MYYADLVKGFAIVTNKIVNSKSANLLPGISLCFFSFRKAANTARQGSRFRQKTYHGALKLWTKAPSRDNSKIKTRHEQMKQTVPTPGGKKLTQH